MSATSPVLITGSAGRIGQAVVRELVALGQPVRGFDLVPTAGATESVVGSISNAADVGRAVKGVGSIVHLAATPDDDDFHACLLPNNIVGVYELLEAARAEGVRRVILASSGQVVWWQRMRGELPIGPDVQPTPRGWYAATKMFQEAAGRAFAEAHDRSVIAVRLGWCPRTREQAREIAITDWARDVYLSPADAGRFFAAAVTSPLHVRFSILYACSKPAARETYDLSGAKALLGWEPRDTWPQGVEEMLG